jgi:hypothetical protein
MQIPAVMFIESAADSIPNLDRAARGDQQEELTSFGDVRAQAIGASGLSKDFRAGYELGLQTARVIISESAALAIASVKPDDVL